MKPFNSIAIIHDDILSGNLTMDRFAADLWEAFHGRGPKEYYDPELFFKKTYETDNLKELISIVEKRIKGNGGDSVIQLQTPFGGGKTHALIALMHKASEWNAKKVVIVGTNLNAEDTLWGIIEKQLTGKIEILKEKSSPGKDKLRQVIEKHTPLLILIDELLEYMTKAKAEKIGKSTLAEQTIAFMQEITELVKSLDKVCLVVTLPSSSMTEVYDQSNAVNLEQLKKICGRLEKIYEPVSKNDISKVICKRLFKSINLNEVKGVVDEFIEYAKKERILPNDIDESEYRKKFIDSYPFLPDIIDVLYHRWGSYPSFQRTRGVLRILSLVIYNIIKSKRNISYITLADFNLEDSEIKQELVKHIGNEYNSVISEDIIGSKMKSINNNVGDAYKHFELGTRIANTIFMYSFSGGSDNGAYLNEIKRNAAILNEPSAIISELVEKLKNQLFFIQYSNDKYYFNNIPNLNKMVLNKKENIQQNKILEIEKEEIKNCLSNEKKFDIYIWETKSSNIADNENLKLIILKDKDEKLINDIVEYKGNEPRIYRNTLIFLCPSLNEKAILEDKIRDYLAYDSIKSDKTLKLNDEQKAECEKKYKSLKQDISEYILRAYQIVIMIGKNKTMDEIILGVPIYGEKNQLDLRVYEKLKQGNKILDTISYYVISKTYLEKNDAVSTKQILEVSRKTPGELIFLNSKVLENGIIDGVRAGEFGLGEKTSDGKDICKYFKTTPIVTFNDNEVIIKKEQCTSSELESGKEISKELDIKGEAYKIENIEEKDNTKTKVENNDFKIAKIRKSISFKIKFEKMIDITRLIMSYKDHILDAQMTFNCEFTKQQYDKLIETFNQLGLEFEEKDI